MELLSILTLQEPQDSHIGFRVLNIHHSTEIMSLTLLRDIIFSQDSIEAAGPQDVLKTVKLEHIHKVTRTNCISVFTDCMSNMWH